MIDISKYGLSAFGATPSKRQIEHYNIGKKAFFHFGVNTFSGKEWGNGEEKESLFNPSELNTDQWIRSIKDAGFKLAIITAKHHDGFCLWPSKYTEHTVKNSPYKNGNGDVIREFTDSCRKFGIKAGVYISPWDRNSVYWGKDEYSEFYANQLTELMTQYGEIHEVWWDGAGSAETRYDWGLWRDIVRKYQPDAAIFGSLGAADYVDLRWVGNERGYAGETHWASINPEYLLNENTDMLNVGEIGGERYIPSETDVSVRQGWFYHDDQDNSVKSPMEINKIWFESIGRNSMMLLNFPPDRRGFVCDSDAESALISHQCISKMLSVNYVDNATVTALDAYMDIFTADSKNDTRNLKVYPAYTVEIELPKSEKVNVFAVSELVEAGERVNGFALEAVDDRGNTELLYSGESIGFYRAVRIKEGKYKRLRFTVISALAKPLLMNFGIHYFEDYVLQSIDLKSNDGANIVKSIEADDSGKCAVAMFGGIFPFNHVEFTTERGKDYKVYAFNGSSYYLIASGVTESERVTLSCPQVIDGSYQIKIEGDSAVSDVFVAWKE